MHDHYLALLLKEDFDRVIHFTIQTAYWQSVLHWKIQYNHDCVTLEDHLETSSGITAVFSPKCFFVHTKHTEGKKCYKMALRH